MKVTTMSGTATEKPPPYRSRAVVSISDAAAAAGAAALAAAGAAAAARSKTAFVTYPILCKKSVSHEVASVLF